MFNYPLDLLLFFGCMLSFLMGITHIFTKKKSAENIMYGVLLLCYGLALIRYLFIKHHLELWSSLPVSFYFTLTYLIAPVGYLAIKQNIDKDFTYDKRVLFHFLPLFLMIACDIYLAILPANQKSAVIEEIFMAGFSRKNTVQMSFLWGVKGFCYMVIFSYIVFLLYKMIHYWKLEESETFIRITFLLVLHELIAISLMLAAFITGFLFLRKASYFSVSLLSISLFFYSSKYPEFFPRLQKEMTKQKYQRSRILGLDLEQIEVELYRLLEDEKVCFDENLTLENLASRLSITHHQLSEFLNSKMNCGFRMFINQFRIKEAIKLLKAEPNKNILTIAYQVGFNSRSSFNTTFTKLTGKSPKAFRDQACLEIT